MTLRCTHTFDSGSSLTYLFSGAGLSLTIDVPKDAPAAYAAGESYELALKPIARPQAEKTPERAAEKAEAIGQKAEGSGQTSPAPTETAAPAAHTDS